MSKPEDRGDRLSPDDESTVLDLRREVKRLERKLTARVQELLAMENQLQAERAERVRRSPYASTHMDLSERVQRLEGGCWEARIAAADLCVIGLTKQLAGAVADITGLEKDVRGAWKRLGALESQPDRETLENNLISLESRVDKLERSGDSERTDYLEKVTSDFRQRIDKLENEAVSERGGAHLLTRIDGIAARGLEGRLDRMDREILPGIEKHLSKHAGRLDRMDQKGPYSPEAVATGLQGHSSRLDELESTTTEDRLNIEGRVEKLEGEAPKAHLGTRLFALEIDFAKHIRSG